MISDSERREVARRLRKLAGGYVRVGDIEKALGIDMTSPTVDLERDARNINRLADLIEPPLQCPHYHSDTHYCSIHEGIQPIDRDALLALADDIDKQTDGSMFDAWLEDGHYIARRIREAVGA